MSIRTTLSTGLATAGLLAGGLAAPGLAHANDADMAVDLPFTLEDEQDEITFSMRNFAAYTGLTQASRADRVATQTVTLFTADPGIVSIDLDAHGEVMTFSSVGFGNDADLDLVFAAESLYGDLYGSGHITDGTGFMVDLEAQTGIMVVGLADVVLEQQMADMWVYVDPMVSVGTRDAPPSGWTTPPLA